eukprot:CAMPEP_0185183782 /NCGR_PEP_ID=MMETSP1140-20130426/2172_1 /TAXON_ID=298111 /ORGANISM="Pavlova sp., Strain CCMP459" /LENGTH=248 /DNA_ID=CAMNT_0027749807 /DNA_START=291 /DNA_END=1033 /DNA_ORIENTATION=-
MTMTCNTTHAACAVMLVVPNVPQKSGVVTGCQKGLTGAARRPPSCRARGSSEHAQSLACQPGHHPPAGSCMLSPPPSSRGVGVGRQAKRPAALPYATSQKIVRVPDLPFLTAELTTIETLGHLAAGARLRDVFIQAAARVDEVLCRLVPRYGVVRLDYAVGGSVVIEALARGLARPGLDVQAAAFPALLLQSTGVGAMRLDPYTSAAEGLARPSTLSTRGWLRDVTRALPAGGGCAKLLASEALDICA